MSTSTSQWIEDEFKTINFNDPRLNKRFFKLATELAERPEDSIHSASTDWAATKAAYRFFDNPEVESDTITKAHLESTGWRCSSHQKIIIAQDTCYVDFNSHQKTKNLGKSFKSHGKHTKGICIHAGLAMSAGGLPLGLTYNKLWIRKETKTSPHERTSLPIQLKESYRWIECSRRSKEILGGDKQVIVVADREGDIYEVFEDAYREEIDLVTRCQHDRKLDDGDKISEVVANLSKRGSHSVLIPGSGSRKERKAKLEIRFGRIELSARPNELVSKQNRHRKNIELYVVDAAEPEGDLHWRLLTTLPVEKLQDAKDILNYYKMRWNVELYFKALKTGCTIEKCRLGEGGKLIKYIALMSVVAWRLFWMTFISRKNPDINCQIVLTESEWKSAWLMLNRKKIKEGKVKKSELPKKPPSLREAIRWIAGSGGFLGRKGDGEPGFLTFWRGWMRVSDAADMYEMFN